MQNKQHHINNESEKTESLKRSTNKNNKVNGDSKVKLEGTGTRTKDANRSTSFDRGGPETTDHSPVHYESKVEDFSSSGVILDEVSNAESSCQNLLKM